MPMLVLFPKRAATRLTDPPQNPSTLVPPAVFVMIVEGERKPVATRRRGDVVFYCLN